MKKTYVVTGANRGIGLEFVRQLTTEGHEVIATARSVSSAKTLQGLQKETSHVHVEELDVTSEDSVAAFAERLANRGVDVLINNAGILTETEAALDELSVEAVRESFDVNSLGALRVTRALLPHLQRSKSPLVANMTSLMGSIADNKAGKAYGYRMSKAALNMFTKCLACDYPELRVVCLHPGWVQTDMGGENALITPEESVHGLLKVLAAVKPEDSGSFFNFRGQLQPW